MNKFEPRLEREEKVEYAKNGIYIVCCAFVKAFRRRNSPWNLENIEKVLDNALKQDIKGFKDFVKYEFNFGQIKPEGNPSFFRYVGYGIDNVYKEMKNSRVSYYINLYVPHGNEYIRYRYDRDDMISKEQFEKDKVIYGNMLKLKDSYGQVMYMTVGKNGGYILNALKNYSDPNSVIKI